MRQHRTLHHGKTRTPGENSTIVSVKAQNFLSFLHFCYFNGLILSRNTTANNNGRGYLGEFRLCGHK